MILQILRKQTETVSFCLRVILHLDFILYWLREDYFPVEDLKTLRHIGSYLQGHPDMKHIPGVDMSSGSSRTGNFSGSRHGFIS